MYYFGIDIGGTKCAVTLGKYEDEKMDIVSKKRFETVGTPECVMERFVSSMRDILKEESLGFSDIASCGISCGGPLDPRRGVILSPPNLPGWDEVHIVDYIKSKTGVKTILENDANACAVAEWKLGAGRGFDNIVFLTFGTGLGAGLILDGRLYSGTNGNAGEVGHIRLTESGPVGFGKAGSFEGWASGSGIAQIGKTIALERIQNGCPPEFCKDISLLDSVTAKKLADFAESGDEAAKEAYAISGRMLGKGLSMIVDILNPERIIIGSVFARSGHLMTEECEKVMKRECLALSLGVCRVVPAELSENIGDYAALSLALSAN